MTALQFAASNGHLGMVDILLAHGADVNGVGDFGLRYSGEAACPLELAVNTGSHAVAKRLLDAGAQVSACGPLQTAARGGNARMVALGAAIRCRSLAVVDCLIAAGADVNKPLPCAGHLMRGYGIYGGLSIPDTLEPKAEFGGHAQCFSLLHVAVGTTWRQGVTTLLDAGANVNHGFEEGRLTPLGYAVYIDWVTGAKMLLDRGPDPRISLTRVEGYDVGVATAQGHGDGKLTSIYSPGDAGP